MGNFRRLPVTERIERLSMPEPNSGCWLWVGRVDQCGYGMAWNDGRDNRSAHRLSYEAFVGPIPEGFELDHKCRTRCCVNPSHLEPVTHAINMARGLNARKTHCKCGLPLSGDNVYSGKNGRNCRACNRAAVARYNARKRAARSATP